MPAAFYPSSTLTPAGPARCMTAAFILCLLVLCLALGASSVFWVVLGVVLAVVIALGGGGQGQGGGEGASPVAHFGFPAQFHLVNGEEGDMTGLGERPQVRTSP